MDNVNRILAVDKPVGWTSHDVVSKIRGELGRKTKVGHGGTLDPFATGLLLILIGKAVKRFDEIRTWEKEYMMTVKLGEATDTGDPTGKIVTTSSSEPEVSQNEVERVLASFVPGYEQTVPIYSAVKIGGRRAYKLARAGKEFIQPKRFVKIKEIELINLQGPTLQVKVVCGSGTYMRQLAVDIGEKLGWPAHCAALRRTRLGTYKVKPCRSSLRLGLMEEQIKAAEIFFGWTLLMAAVKLSTSCSSLNESFPIIRCIRGALGSDL
ncbi:tRNA pseudouridine(55) synthase TruB [Candidatus Beckwithbacteria bacterium CG_4_10_14_0_2_um_filter_47_25]|uniref:tRNA pseudouridine synthase B n=3 Tax=Candidatus Beckwithiibacteriota TaxID=1752726 RepID=A0A1J4RPJ8_9BACT|nr:MAG: tRNA pseudouridine(55) synthase TruB [Candidatus Beckwithbacteria bacterium CG1_02_47_37]PIP52574.1 MAG: tRNA pseudouridine(55) synthase TruB [Candidatus Beckwithbacteria bacterium CG23_combo_of_CG06-09_8_20_14_all_47_9]PJA22340.1 MAG: tRNA pseudouridine(55) synthase TruB [Candidatus Beckwithbacteria bacterium CG_4_10_14_0_2_um_filter_47_25]